MAKVLIVVEDGPIVNGVQKVEVSVVFDPPVKDPNDSRTWTGAQRIGNAAIEIALKRKGVRRKSDAPLPKHTS